MKRLLLLFFIVSVFSSGCAQTIPREALALQPESLANRQLQTRRFETTDYGTMLSSASAVFQDLGFTLDESEYSLGIIVGSKHRDATSGAQIAGAVVVALLGGGAVPIDKNQIIRASMVMREISPPTEKNTPPHKLNPKELQSIKDSMTQAVTKGLIARYPEEISKRVAAIIAENAAQSLTNDLAKLVDTSGGGESTVRVTFQRVIYNTQGQVTRAEQIVDPDVYKDFFDKLSQSVFLEAHEL